MSKQLLAVLSGFLIVCSMQAQSLLWSLEHGEAKIERARKILYKESAIYVVGQLLMEEASSGKDGGGIDIVLIKLDLEGKVEWEKVYGGSGDDEVTGILNSQTGKLILFGYTESEDGIFSEGPGGVDGFVLVIDPEGGLEHASKIGGSMDDYVFSGALSSEGKIYLAGVSESFDHGLEGLGLLNGWLSCITGEGELIWQRSYGGSHNEVFSDICLSKSGSVFLCGRTGSDDHDVVDFRGTPNSITENGWLLKTDANGEIQDQFCYGDSDENDISFSCIVNGNADLVYVGGETSPVSDSGYHGFYRPFIMQLNESLDPLRQYLGSSETSGELNQLLLGKDGSLFAVGARALTTKETVDPLLPLDLYFAKFTEDLSCDWEYVQYGKGHEFGWSGALDIEESLYICGQSDRGPVIQKYGTVAVEHKEVDLCMGQGVFIGNIYIEGLEFYRDTLTAVSGCDSIVQYHFNYHPVYQYETALKGLCNDQIQLHDSVISHSGDYLFSYPTAMECDSAFLYHIEFIDIDCQVSVTEHSLASLQQEGSYQWYDCETGDSIMGATEQTYHSEGPGSFKVRIEVQGCKDESDCYDILATHEMEGKEVGVQIYPNPARSLLHVFPGNLEIESLCLIDPAGRVQMMITEPQGLTTLDLSDFSSGLYYMQIRTIDSIILKKIIKE